MDWVGSIINKFCVNNPELNETEKNNTKTCSKF